MTDYPQLVKSNSASYLSILRVTIACSTKENQKQESEKKIQLHCNENYNI